MAEKATIAITSDDCISSSAEVYHLARSKVIETLGYAFEQGLAHTHVAAILRDIADSLMDGSLARDPFSPRDSRLIPPVPEILECRRIHFEFVDRSLPAVEAPLGVPAAVALETNLSRLDRVPRGWASNYDLFCRRLAALGETALVACLDEQNGLALDFDRELCAEARRLCTALHSATRIVCGVCGKAATPNPTRRMAPARCWKHLEERDRPKL